MAISPTELIRVQDNDGLPWHLTSNLGHSARYLAQTYRPGCKGFSDQLDRILPDQKDMHFFLHPTTGDCRLGALVEVEDKMGRSVLPSHNKQRLKLSAGWQPWMACNASVGPRWQETLDQRSSWGDYDASNIEDSLDLSLAPPQLQKSSKNYITTSSSKAPSSETMQPNFERDFLTDVPVTMKNQKSHINSDQEVTENSGPSTSLSLRASSEQREIKREFRHQLAIQPEQAHGPTKKLPNSCSTYHQGSFGGTSQGVP
ncbi:hypothetical protein PGTUg99_005141 [Puccinia graminis f. sp. tritici]|uniref:Uncharacterized protein n=1 Tax=Puccinia graminis f. sp. tritici TaxID=56615 RepID=A0A5B0R5T2_PUCGR|nr:hypothetical protein PGTUg99_005141 [Puccinia graminis f. sp. tritici]